ncbi:MAG: DUF3618 domain-containing protein [Sphingomonas sp.]
MTDIEPTLAMAENHSVAARRQLAGTLVEIQARLNPKALAREAAQELRQAGEELARDGMEAVKRHPLTLAGIAGAVVLFLARRPLRSLIAQGDAADATLAPSPRLPTRTSAGGKPK